MKKDAENQGGSGKKISLQQNKFSPTKLSLVLLDQSFRQCPKAPVVAALGC